MQLQDDTGRLRSVNKSRFADGRGLSGSLMPEFARTQLGDQGCLISLIFCRTESNNE